MYPISFTFLFNILQHEVFPGARASKKPHRLRTGLWKNTSFQSDMTLDHLLFAKQTPQIVPVALICRTGAGIPMDFRRHQSWVTLKDVELNTKTTFNLNPWIVQARYLDKRKLVENIDFEATKCQNWRHDMLVLMLPRVSSRVSGFSCGIAVSMGIAAKTSPFRRFPSTLLWTSKQDNKGQETRRDKKERKK